METVISGMEKRSFQLAETMGFANSIISWRRQANCVSGARQSFKDRVSRLFSLSPATFLSSLCEVLSNMGEHQNTIYVKLSNKHFGLLLELQLMYHQMYYTLPVKRDYWG